MAKLDIWIEKWKNWTVVHLHGDLMLSTLGQFRETLNALLRRKNPRITLDLAELANVDSSAIGLITRFTERTVERGGEFGLFNARREAAEVLAMVQFDCGVRLFSTRHLFERSVADREASE